MITTITFGVWLILIVFAITISMELETIWSLIIWGLLSLLWIVPIFTGVHVPNNSGQYQGYITAVEQNGAIFKGWNVYLKTDLQSSNEDIACINRDNSELIEELKQIQESKQNVVLEYEGVWQYAIGECPKTDWMIINVK